MVFLRSQDRVFFFLPKQSENINKMDLDLWDCSGRVKIVLQQNFIGLICALVAQWVKCWPSDVTKQV